MAKNPETIIQEAIMKNLDDRKILNWRDTSSQKFGEADIKACYRGYYVTLEVKTETGRPTLLQEKKLKSVKRAGGFGGFVTSIVDVNFILADIDEQADKIWKYDELCQ